MKRIFAKLSVALMMLSAIAIPFRSAGQTTEPDQTPPSGSPTSAPSQAPAPPPISWKLLVPNLLSDQERVWTFPARLVQGQGRIPTIPYAACGTAALVGFSKLFTGGALGQTISRFIVLRQ
jgi:hypothetical protein